jgi:hypothetical protein
LRQAGDELASRIKKAAIRVAASLKQQVVASRPPLGESVVVHKHAESRVDIEARLIPSHQCQMTIPTRSKVVVRR